MLSSTSYRRGYLFAGSVALLMAATGPLMAQPGFSPMDKSNPKASQQDNNLKPIPTPPVAPSIDKIPLDKIKLPAGFKAEVWSSGHPGGRTMVMGDKGTMFMGSRVIGRVYAVTDKGADANPYSSLPRAAEPAVTADVARALSTDDAKALSNQLDMEVLQQLQTAIEPLTDIRSMKFVGAVEKNGRTLAAYVAGGRTSDGTDVLVGFVLRVTGDQIVGVN